MATWKQYTVALLGITILSNLWMASVEAKPGKGKKDAQPPVTQTVTPPTTQTTTVGRESFSFSSSQRTQLADLLSGRAVRNDVLDANTRNLIASQISSLPPGIQKRLVRGKGLPPGIAKKVILPKTVNSYLNIPAQYDLMVIGSNVVLYNSVASVITDLITRII